VWRPKIYHQRDQALNPRETDMKKSTVIWLFATACAVGGCHRQSETADASNTNTSPPIAMANDGNDASNGAMKASAVATRGQLFANNAAASDAFEVQTSKLALDNSQSSAVKKFATQMIAAHTQSTGKLKALAANLSPAIVPDPTLAPDQQAKLDALKDKKGSEFDSAYAAVQVAGHQQTLDKVRSYAGTGDVPELKSFAQTLAPIVAAHLNMAKALKP
jgi:putative membrane protein